MKVLVISGSPKGQYSVTVQSAIYLSKYFADDKFTIVDVGAKIKSFEKDFSQIPALIDDAEIVLICYPVYTCLATSQLHTFFELMEKNNVDFSKKYVVQYTTSKHFYDMTAHRAVEQIVDDFNGKYVAGLTQDMNDLTTENGRKQLIDFWKYTRYCVQNNVFIKPNNKIKCENVSFDYIVENVEKTYKKSVALITNVKDDDTTLNKMIDAFIKASPFNISVFNISDMNIRGGCLGCLNCASDGTCIYKDGFPALLREKIESQDGFVFAFTPHLHTMGADFKTFDDRRFCNGHRTLSMGKPCAFISGKDLDNDKNLYELLEARAEIAENFNAGIITPSLGIDHLLDVVKRMDYSLSHNFHLEPNFYGVGGRMIFRDLVYIMQGIMRADYKFYEKEGFFNSLPHKQKGTMRLMKLAGIAFNNKKIKAKIGSKIDEGMIMNHRKAIDNIPSDKAKFGDN